MRGSSLQSSSRMKPFEGMSERMILPSSSMMRSFEMISMRERLRSMAAKVSGSMRKLSCVANRMARIMRRGSSLKVMSGSSGVRIIPFSRSSIPPKGSTSSPQRSRFRHRARALMVKSRRFWSSCRVPSSTTGLRESWLYDSLRAPTNSISKFSPRRLYFTWAVPKLRKVERWARLPSRAVSASASSMPLPRVTMSMSLEGRFRKMSRT